MKLLTKRVQAGEGGRPGWEDSPSDKSIDKDLSVGLGYEDEHGSFGITNIVREGLHTRAAADEGSEPGKLLDYD